MTAINRATQEGFAEPTAVIEGYKTLFRRRIKDLEREVHQFEHVLLDIGWSISRLHELRDIAAESSRPVRRAARPVKVEPQTKWSADYSCPTCDSHEVRVEVNGALRCTGCGHFWNPGNVLNSKSNRYGTNVEAAFNAAMKRK